MQNAFIIYRMSFATQSLQFSFIFCLQNTVFIVNMSISNIYFFLFMYLICFKKIVQTKEPLIANISDKKLEDTISQIDLMIDNLTRFYDESETKSQFQPWHKTQTDEEINDIPLFNLAEKRSYLDLFAQFFEWVSNPRYSHENNVKKLAQVGTSFLMYNELLNAIDESAEEVLITSRYPQLVMAQTDTTSTKIRDYTLRILKLYSDYNFLNEEYTTRIEVLNRLQEMIGDIFNLFLQ